jgi:hypothetical protein
MFDEFVSVRVAPDGIVQERRYVTGEETLAWACGMLLSARAQVSETQRRPGRR